MVYDINGNAMKINTKSYKYDQHINIRDKTCRMCDRCIHKGICPKEKAIREFHRNLVNLTILQVKKHGENCICLKLDCSHSDISEEEKERMKKEDKEFWEEFHNPTTESDFAL